MASKHTLQLVLSALVGAPNSIGVEDILSCDSRLTPETVRDGLASLTAGGYVKENRDLPGKYFTLRATRSTIENFLRDDGGTAILPSVEFTPDVLRDEVELHPVTARLYGGVLVKPLLGLTVDVATVYRRVLTKLAEAPEAVHRDSVPYASWVDTILENLKNLRIIKEHRDRPSYYFTRKPLRGLIAEFIRSPEMSAHDFFTRSVAVNAATTATRTPAPVEATTAGPAEQSLFRDIPVVDFKQILKDLIEAPNSLAASETHPSMNDEKWIDAIKILSEAGLIKEHRDRPDCYFTRNPKRDAIRAFLGGHMSFANLVAGDETVGVAADNGAVNVDDAGEEAAYATVLEEILSSPQAAYINGLAAKVKCTLALSSFARTRKILDGLIEAELVKEHRDKPGYYFTRKPMRRKIEVFLNTEDISFEELLDPDFDVDQPEAAGPTDTFDQASGTDDMAEMINLLETMRNMINIFLSRYGQ